MENKIQQLTEKLYNEGINKGKQASDQIIADAKKEAGNIIDQAKKEAAKIVENATNEAAELKKNTQTELRLASAQLVSDLKIQIQNLVSAKGIAADIQNTYTNGEFVKEMILTAVKSWGEKETGGVRVIVPEGSEDSVREYLSAQIGKALKDGVEITGSGSITNGFRLAPSNGGYYISFTDEDFTNLFTSYLRPKTMELLYKGE